MAIRTFYVNTDTGNDTTGDGSAGAPYKSLNKAIGWTSNSTNGIRTANNHYGEDFSNITAAGTDDSLVIECSGVTADVQLQVYDAVYFTTDSTHTITVNGDNTTGKYSTSHYRIEHTTTGSYQTNALFRDDYTFVNDLQAKTTCSNVAHTAPYGMQLKGEASEFNRCIAVGVISNDPPSARGLLTNNESDNYKIRNCLAYGWKGGSGSGGFLGVSASGAGTCEIANCTAYDCTDGFKTSYQHTIIKNCLAMECTEWGFSDDDWYTGSDYNASNTFDRSLGSNSSRGAGANFVDAANGNFMLASNDTVALGQGTSLSGDFTDDVIGLTRSIWSIGAFESIGRVYINDAPTLNGNEVLQTYPGDANWSPTEIAMQTVPDITGLSAPLWLIVQRADGQYRSKEITLEMMAGWPYQIRRQILKQMETLLTQ